MVARTFIIQVQAAPPSGSAAWFASQADKTWQAIPSVNTVNDAFAGQVAISGATNTGILDAWNGACVDQVRGEYLLVANGGHDDYRGNEVYALALRTASPKWYRLLDHSPNSAISPVQGVTNSTSNLPGGQGWGPSGYAAMYADGRMRAVHGWYSTVFWNNRAWLVMQGSPTGAGNSSSHAWSFNRAHPGLATAYGQTPLAWSNDAGPWEWLGNSTNGGRGATESAPIGFNNNPGVAVDPVTGLVWFVRGDQGNWMAGFGSINTTTEAIQHVNYNPGYQQPIGCAAVVVDPAWDGVAGDPNGTCRWRMFVAVSSAGSQLLVLNLKAANPYATSSWSFPSLSTTTGVLHTGNGMVYHKASRSLICADPVRTGNGTVYKVRVPTNGDGTYNSAGTWNVTAIAAGGANPSIGSSPGQGGGYSYGKMKLVENIANGQDGIVLVNGVNLPTYVYKLPATEIS